MYRKVDIESWERRDHYRFFKKFEEPFFGLTVEVDGRRAREVCQSEGHSFFLYYLHASLFAANQTRPFRLRIQGEEVLEYEQVHASPTINRPDGTFGFAYMDFKEDFELFQKQARKEIDRVQGSHGLEPAITGENVIHYSSLPWLRFTSLSHARSFSFADSCPKISFGKLVEEGSKMPMPVAVHAHHALMDGFHVGEFFKAFQQALDR